MYDGYLTLGGIEILNQARAAAYVSSMLNGRVEVHCDDAELRTALTHSEYTTPARDQAAWYTGKRAAGGRFLGLFPGSIRGAEDSTRRMDVTELSGDGAVMTTPRYGGLEMRVKATAFALDEEAMMEGWAWLRQALSNDGCSDADLGCTGRQAQMFAALPGTPLQAYSLARTFHRVEVTEGPKPLTKHPTRHRGHVSWEVEFTLTAGIPWAFTSLADVGNVSLDTATNFLDPEGENCSAVKDAYDTFVDDPFFTGITRPPRPPVILPPNILKVTSWRRKVLPIPAVQTQRWGRVVPVVHVVTATAVQYLRLRFYEAGKSGCAFEGEFLISYLPAKAVLKLDGILREATLTLEDGRVVPAGHLLFGSDGRPFLWPALGCQKTYQMTADLMPGQSGVVVMLQSAVRD